MAKKATGKTTKNTTGKKKAPAKKKGPSMDKRLIAAAEDLNDVIGLEPPLDTDSDIEELKAEIIEIADADVAESDPLTDETWALFEELEIGPKVNEEGAKEEEEKKAAPKDKSKAKKSGSKKKGAGKKKEGMATFLQETLKDGLGDRHEDDVVLEVKEKFPEKSYRVIGNAIYAVLRKQASGK